MEGNRFNSIFVHAHSGLRWIVLLLVVYAIINAAKSMNSGQYTKKDKMINLFAMISLHMQFLLGLILMFLSSKVTFASDRIMLMPYRFFNIEHLFGMLLAIVLITIGRKKAETKLKGSRDKHRRIMITYSIGLLIILAMIPWPFREALGGAWF